MLVGEPGEGIPVNQSLTVIVAMALAFAIGCAPKATPDEARKACEKQVAVQQGIAAAQAGEDPVDQVVAAFLKRLDDLKARQTQAVEEVSLACEADAQKAGGSVTPDVEAACVAAMGRKAQEFAPEFQALNREKLDAIQDAFLAREKAQEAAKAQARKDVDDCTARALQDGLTQAKAACQLAAPTLDDFRKCR
jgi:hypothetical protein